MNFRLKVEILKQYPIRGRHEPSPELRRALAQKLRLSEGELFHDAE